MNAESIVETYLTENGFEDLKGYEGLYKINQTGDIWSCWYNKVMKHQETEDGYLCLRLKKSDGGHKGYIHRLLAIQYIDNPDNLPEVDHIDRNRKNNDLSNLRWVDKKTQNNNKKDNIASLSEEEQQQRIIDIREYKRVWAENNRREKGIPQKRTFETEEERKEAERESHRISQQKRRAERTPEQKEEDNRKQKEAREKRLERMTPEELEAFRNKEKERTKKHREQKNQK